MKYKVRTKQGAWTDGRIELTEKWQDVEEADISSTWIEHPNIEIQTAGGKAIPTPDPVPGVSLPRVAVPEAEAEDATPDKDDKPEPLSHDKKDETKPEKQ